MLFFAHLCQQLKVKASDTRYRVLGLELIPVYRQSTQWKAAITFHREVTFPAAEYHRHLAGTHFTIPQRVEGWVNLGVSN